MATITTQNYYLPQDGSWFQIAAGGTYNFLDIHSFPCNHGFYVYIGDDTPDDADRGVVGIKVDGECYFINVPFTVTGGIWARCLTPAYGGTDNNAQLRLDVTLVTDA